MLRRVGSSPSTLIYTMFGVSKWSKEEDCKSSASCFAGSNPASTILSGDFSFFLVLGAFFLCQKDTLGFGFDSGSE